MVAATCTAKEGVEILVCHLALFHIFSETTSVSKILEGCSFSVIQSLFCFRQAHTSNLRKYAYISEYQIDRKKEHMSREIYLVKLRKEL